ncbi:GDSL esterase/lipase At5g45960 isoform X2 [Euphorbia lathyris]|uniref:GDSL esterase/lipase At5g45960 isoform X2 n=1 Tax=Euphorbia lathyris TaxID=212925 RepID=UPI00331384ED
METTHKFIYFFLLHFLLITVSESRPLSYDTMFKSNLNHSVTAVLVFGDSTVDSGNNNFVPTIFKGNFPPYGIDFPDQQPTGRFTNGRLATDFVASYVGVKEFVPPYLDPSLSIEELMSGVCFASAGTGFDPLTPKISNVIEISKQVEYFREYKKKIEKAIGKERMENHIRRALYIISAGTNDFVVNYFTLPIRRKTFSLPAYERFILHNSLQFLQELFDEGARKMLFATLPPMGCLPIVITLFSKDPILERGCLDHYSSVAREFNSMLEYELNKMNLRLAKQGFKIALNDAYGPLIDMIQGPASAAFDDGNSGCCGTGLLETGILCNPKSFLCPDPSNLFSQEYY